jgi:hypothetical protein
VVAAPGIVEAGHTDATAMPRLAEDSCAAWTDEAAAALAAEHGTRGAVSMERALRVGMPMLACRGCPLSGMGRNAPPDRSGELDFLVESGWTVHEAEAEAGGVDALIGGGWGWGGRRRGTW